jgi:site-specific DNA-adenine methylase
MSYPGGKGGSGVAQAIINQIPPHRIYVEGFLGSGTVLRTKRPAEMSVGIEADADIVSRWVASPAQSDGTAPRWQLPPSSTVVCGDAISWLAYANWHGDEFVYLDPPYLFDARSSKSPIYKHEYGTVSEHLVLLSLIKTLPVNVAISGYYSDLYAQNLAGWRTITFNTVDRAGNIKQEWLWMNYPEPTELHDYRFLGKDYRQRERLAKMRRRWVARLAQMPQLERLMLSAAIAENGVASTTAAGDRRR